MDKNLIAVVLLSVGILVVWQKFVAIPPEPPKVSATASADGGTTPDKVVLKDDGTKVAADAKPGEPSPAKEKQEQLVPYDMPGRYHAVLSTNGAGFHDFELVDPRHQEKTKTGTKRIDLAPAKDQPLPFSITFPSSGFQLPADASFELVSQEGNVRAFSWTDGKVKVVKTYTFVPDTYEVKLDITVENTTAAILPASLQLILSGWQNPESPPGFWIFKPQTIDTEGLCSNGKVKREKLASVLKEPLEQQGPVRIAAIDRKWFVTAVAVPGVDGTTCRVTGVPEGRMTTTLSLPAATIAAGAKQTWSMVGFIGPKIVTELDAVKLDGKDAHMGDVMNYGFTEIFARPMLWVLKKIQQAIGNWGIAIILLTLLIKLVTWWPTTQSMKSAQAMARLKPEMDKLKEKYGDDKAKMNAEVMVLYQKHKINPLGGCLPILIQMPIYIALYSMLGNSVELYRANFGFWIHDLTAPDPFFVLPLLTGLGMFLQQKLSPTPPDPSQKTMMTIMPVMYTGMSIFLPSGLTLYILTNTLLSMLQQRMAAPKKA